MKIFAVPRKSNNGLKFIEKMKQLFFKKMNAFAKIFLTKVFF